MVNYVFQVMYQIGSRLEIELSLLTPHSVSILLLVQSYVFSFSSSLANTNNANMDGQTEPKDNEQTIQ